MRKHPIELPQVVVKIRDEQHAHIASLASASQGGVWSTGAMERPEMRMSGPVLDAPDVTELTHFYERLLGWEVEAFEGPRPGDPPGGGWSRLRPSDGSTKIE